MLAATFQRISCQGERESSERGFAWPCWGLNADRRTLCTGSRYGFMATGTNLLWWRRHGRWKSPGAAVQLAPPHPARGTGGW
jgi:hypothetical protein